MEITFLPEEYRRATETTVFVPAPDGVPDLPDLAAAREQSLSPRHVEIRLQHEELPTTQRTRVYVLVHGPRRLVSGDLGQPTSSGGWERTVNKAWTGRSMRRPQWLADIIAVNAPAGWALALLDLGAPQEPEEYRTCGAALEREEWPHTCYRRIAHKGQCGPDRDPDPAPETHRPTLVHFGSRHATPAEVCWSCSDAEAGRWVPVTQCPASQAQMTDDPASLYADSITLPGPSADETDDESEGETP